jgi:regulator of nucleoside diphosphate kinase
MNTNDIILSADDAEVISNLVGAGGLPSMAGPAGEALADSIEAARVVPADELPPTVVGLNNRVRYREPDGTVREIMLVLPEAADVGTGRVSVLSPVGRALIGRSVGTECRVALPGGGTLVILINEVVASETV